MLRKHRIHFVIPVDCDFENNTCDWRLVTSENLHRRLIYRSPILKRHEICGFHGLLSSCEDVFDMYIDLNVRWMIGNVNNITDQIVKYVRNTKPDLNISQLQSTSSKGFEKLDTIVFTHNLDYNLSTSAWSTSYMISDELSFSYQPSCLQYRYFLSGLTSMVISYFTNFNNVYDDIPIRVHSSEGKTEKVLYSSVNLPVEAEFKIIFRFLFNSTTFSYASIDSIKVITEMCSDTCSADEFRCDREECINSELLCDGKADCSDGSDERFCYDDSEKKLCEDTEPVTINGTVVKIIDNDTKSIDQSLHHMELSNKTSCKLECESENIHRETQIKSSAKLQEFIEKELRNTEDGIGVINNSLCSPFCPPTCECFGRSLQCVDMNCSDLIRVITLYSVTCNVIDVDSFDSRHIFTMYISNSIIGNLTISPTNNRTMFHKLHIKDTTLHSIFIEPSHSKLEYLHRMELDNCTIGSSMKGSGAYKFHLYRESALEFHINSLIMAFPTEIATLSAYIPYAISLNIPFKDKVNVSNCGLTNEAHTFYIESKVIDLSHNFLKWYYHWPSANTVLYIQHNLLSNMIIPHRKLNVEIDNLAFIDISYNRITELNQGELLFPKLIYLNFKGNLLHTIHVNAFSETTKLVFLDLSRNKISRIITGTFLPLEFLEELYIQENEFQVSDGIFYGLRRLTFMQVEFFSLCCTKPNYREDLQCSAPVSEISSCENLIDVPLLSVTIWYVAFLATFGNFIVFTYNVHYLTTTSADKYTVFIVNLSLADFLMGIYLNILAITNQMYAGRYGLADYTWRHSATCTVSGIIATLSSETSVLIVFLITLDRFIAVKYPFSKLLFSVKTASILSFIAWMFSLVLSLIPLLPVPGFEDFYAQSGICISLPLSVVRKSGWEYSMIMFVGFNFLLFVGILVGQISVFVEVLRSGRSVGSSKSMQRERHLAISVFGVVLTDVLCWIPIGTIGMLTFFGISVPSDVYAWIVVVVLPINSALNPLLYTLTTVIRRMRKRESDTVSQLKQQLAYWKSKHGYPADATSAEVEERNPAQNPGIGKS